jgi:hypothetical protein
LYVYQRVSSSSIFSHNSQLFSSSILLFRSINIINPSYSFPHFPSNSDEFPFLPWRLEETSSPCWAWSQQHHTTLRMQFLVISWWYIIYTLTYIDYIPQTSQIILQIDLQCGWNRVESAVLARVYDQRGAKLDIWNGSFRISLWRNPLEKLALTWSKILTVSGHAQLMYLVADLCISFLVKYTHGFQSHKYLYNLYTLW